jgi:hypothetical protein
MNEKQNDINKRYNELLRPYYQKYNCRKGQLCHYTDLDCLQNIIQNDELWLSRREYINDVEEIDYSYSLLSDVFKQNNTDKQVMDEILKCLEENKQYVFCLSTEMDVANQWMAYSKNNGYCICFDRKQLILHFGKISNFEVKGGKVNYDRSAICKIFELLTEYFKDVLSEDTSNLLSILNQRNVTELFVLYYGLIKKENYRYENEYRFSVINRNLLKSEYRNRNGILIPYIKIKVENEKLPISKIIIGPTIKDEKAKLGLLELLEKYGYNNVNVEFSKMHMR